jgi:putative phosphoesterase
MLMAILGDIHGNLPALDAVLAAIEDAGIETVLNTGDAVVGWPWPNEVVDALRLRGIPSAQGEMDRLAASFLRKNATLRKRLDPNEYAEVEWAYEHLRSENLEFLRDLPRHRSLRAEGIDILLCHGTPAAQTDALDEDDDEEYLLRQREVANAPLVVCGRTHRAFARSVLDTLFVNPGSVGMPVDGAPLARYAVVNTEDEPWSAELLAVEYDLAEARRQRRALGHPEAE